MGRRVWPWSPWLARRVHCYRAGVSQPTAVGAGRRTRLGVPASRDVCRAGFGAYRRPVRTQLRARGIGRIRRREDVEVAWQPRLRLRAAARGRRPDGDSAGAARPSLPQRLGVHAGRSRCGDCTPRGVACRDSLVGGAGRGRRTRTVRERLGDDLDAPGALAAIDEWAAAALAGGGEDTGAPELVRAIADLLLGIAL